MPTPETNENRDETVLYIKSLWKSLLAPKWTKDDLIDLGKLVFAKVRLSSVDPPLLDRLLPLLSDMADSAWRTLLDLPQDSPPPTRESRALLIRSTWDALLAPTWLRRDLIDLGTAVHDKKTLAELDEALYQRMLPHLAKIADLMKNLAPRKVLENKLFEQLEAEQRRAAPVETAAQSSDAPPASPAAENPPTPAPPTKATQEQSPAPTTTAQEPAPTPPANVEKS